jgi:outer membrane protein OmpA-like peptidoglycan-associated protein
MQSMARKQLIGIAFAGILASVLAPSHEGSLRVAAPAQAADEPSVDAMVKSLKARKTRSIGSPSTAAVGREIEALKQIRKTRGWNMHDRARVAEVARDLPQLDLTIYFAFDSAEITKEAEPTLTKLGQALSQEEFKGRAFILAGHTDARGTPQYNQSLSERRAEAVKSFIATRFKIPAADLMTAGYGFEQLRNAQDPLASENRRVQVVNFSE